MFAKSVYQVANRSPKVTEYMDNAAPLRGFQYGTGGENDSPGVEVSATNTLSNFKTLFGSKNATSYDGHLAAKIGYRFEDQSDFLSRLKTAGEVVNYNLAVILNLGRLAARAAQTQRCLGSSRTGSILNHGAYDSIKTMNAISKYQMASKKWANVITSAPLSTCLMSSMVPTCIELTRNRNDSQC